MDLAMHKPAQHGDGEGREGAALREFQHPNIAVADDRGDGETLRQYLARVGRLPAFQGLALVTQLLSALAFAHRQGRVHGAIDPQRLRVGRTGQLKVEGFDKVSAAAAQAPRPGPCEVSPYSAPQQHEGQPPDHRADLYAAAVVAYEVITGALPFKAGDEPAPDGRPCSARALRPELPVALDAVFERALSHDPGARYPHALDLLAALQAALGDPMWERPPVVASAAVQVDDPPEVPSTLPVAAPILPPAARGFAAGSPSRLLGVLLVGLVLAGSLLEGKPPVPDADRAGAATLGGVHAGPVQRGLPVPAARVTSAQQAYPVTSPAKLTLPPLASVPVPATPAPAGEPLDAAPAHAAPPKPPLERPRPAQPAAVPEGKPAPRGSPARTSSRAAEPAPKSRPPAAPAAKRRPAPPPSLGCGGGDSIIARQFCIALQCAKAEFRRHPVCARIHAEQRARNQLAEVRGGP